MSGAGDVAVRTTAAGRVAVVTGGIGAVLFAFFPAPEVQMLALVGAFLLAAVSFGAFCGRRVLAGVTPAAPGPRTVFAGENFELPLAFTNRGARFALRDAEVALADRTKGRPRPAGSLELLEPGRTATALCGWRLARRGRVRALTVAVSTTFPFGLVVVTRTFELATDFLVLPRLGTVRGVEQRIAAFPGHGGARTRWSRGSEEFWALREWREGESLRLVHWPTSARLGRPVLRELAGEEVPPVRLCLWGRVPPVTLVGGRPASFETAVELAATLAESLCRRGVRVRFSFRGEDSWDRAVPPRRAPFFALLSELALVRPAAATRAERPGRFLAGARRRGELAILVHVGGIDVPTPRSDGAAWILDVDDPRIADVYRAVRRGAAGVGWRA